MSATPPPPPPPPPYPNFPQPVIVPQPPKKTGRLGMLLALCVVVAVVVAWYLSQPKHKSRETKDAEGQKFADASKAFSGTVPLDSADAKSIKADLDGYAAAVARQDFAGAADVIDADRMVDEIEASGAAKGLSGDARRGFVRGVRQGITGALNSPVNGLAVTSIELRKVRMLPGGKEAIVYLKALQPKLGIIKYRWWVSKSSGHWRIYDLEDLSGGLRVSALMGAALAAAGPGMNPPAWIKYVPQIQQLMQAVVARDIATASTLIAQLENAGFPSEMQAVILALKGVTLFAGGKNDEALAAIDAAEALQPELPMANGFRATIYNAMGRHEDAVAAARKYVDVLGDDADVCQQLGLALEQLNRPAEAMDAYRRGTEDDPRDLDDAAGFARLATAEHADEATKRLAAALAAAPDAKAAANVIALRMITKPGISVLIAAYKQTKPADTATLGRFEARRTILPAATAPATTRSPATTAP